MDQEFYTKVEFERDLAVYEETRNLARTRCADGELDGLVFNRIQHQLDALVSHARARYAENGRVFAALRRWKAEVERLEAKAIIPGPEYSRAIKKRNYLKLLVAKILEGTPRSLGDAAPVEPAEPQFTLPWTRVRRAGDKLEVERDGTWQPAELETIRALPRVHYI